MVTAAEAAMTGSQGRATKFSQKNIRALEETFRKSPSENFQCVSDLISMISPTASISSKAIHAVRRCLVLSEQAINENEKDSRRVQTERDEYALSLVSIVENSDNQDILNASVAAAALTHLEVWEPVCRAVMEGSNTSLQELVLDSFIRRFQDLRLGALHIVREQKSDVQTRLRILSACTEERTEFAKSDIGKKEIKTAFVKAWLATIRSEMDPKTRLQVLGRIPSELIPLMPNPLQLSDFLTSNFSSNDLKTSAASLDGMVTLISKHGLDYPLFYQKLYGMLREDVFREVEDPKRFMDLAALLLLQGAMVPGNMLAAFIKRLVRRALCWPTCHALWSLRLSLDIMRKHPSTCFLVHRTVNLFDNVRDIQREVKDPFDDSELDPQASCAEQSSLWELLVLRKHVSPAMSRLVSAFDRDVRARPPPPPGDLLDYAGIAFQDIFHAEVHRKAKTSPLAYTRPGSDPSTIRIRKRLRTCVSWS